MDTCVKVVLDEKEYQRLLEIERKYNEVRADRHQEGAGTRVANCSCQEGGGDKSQPLSQIIAENTVAHAVERPLPGILPAITTAEESPLNTETDVEKPKKHKKAKKKSEKKNITFNSLTAKEKEELGFPRVFYPWYYIGVP